ncbi:rhamnose transport system permease protein [Mesorhizobium albiziae]|uniref:Autoinducer 2 import system permease protein LsrC n=1 Tax=Neomesorhizobium albiziae TaxID=335020 RepID=A0A1I3YSQ9_9HYPH|nr:ABC transporter permease [Mesorhizobium albiziae]GLS33300.1 ABC transporter permease [Mesorhizobium albiziae]SFK34882.1 rhamnose transport system permease protein [Mesorhizobium albiziae]
MKGLFNYRELILASILLVGIAAIGAYQPAFLRWGNISDMLTETSVLFMMALAQMVVILTRGIDLSVAANLALSGMLAALVSQYYPEIPLVLMILTGVVCGLILGLFNGLLIAFLGIPPIVMTLGTLAIFRGLIIIIAGGDQVNASEMGAAFQAFPKQIFLGLASPVWIAIAVSLLFWIFLNYTRAGRGLYAVGGNPVAARYCGIDQRRQELLAYVISGAVAGLCGYLWVARYGVAYSEIASGYELTVIAACVIGGVSIGGGVGSVAGTLLGALFLGIVMTALPVLQISPFWQMAISGAVILAAVVINARAERRPDKLILPEARRLRRV